MAERENSIEVIDTLYESQDEGSRIDYKELVRTCWRGRRLIVMTSVITLLLGAIIAYSTKPYYIATASIIAPSSTQGSALAMLSSQAPALSVLGGARTIGDTYVGVMKSRTVLSGMVSRFNLKSVYKVNKESIAEKRLAGASDFTVGAKDNIVSIAVKNQDPKLAAALANGYLDALREATGKLALTQAAQRRLFFGEQMNKEKNALEDAEVDLKLSQERTGLVAPQGQVTAELESMTQLRAQAAARQVELAALRQSSTEQNPDVIRVRSELANLQAQLAGLQRGNASSPGSVPVGKVPEAAIEVVRKERELKFHETLLDILAKQYASAKIEESQDAPVLQILDNATEPDTKAGPRRLYIMAISLIFGFIGSLVWVLLKPHASRWRQSLAAAASE